MEFRTLTQIGAHPDQVFEVLSTPLKYKQAIPHILEVSFRSESQRGLGTVFRETRMMNGNRISLIREVREFVEGERMRVVTDVNGCVWDSMFAVRPSDQGTEMLFIMEARPYRFLAKVTNYMARKFIQQNVEKDMQCLKTYCEAQAAETRH